MHFQTLSISILLVTILPSEGRLSLDHIRLKLMPYHSLQASDPAPWDHAPSTLHKVYNSREQVVNAAA